MKEAMLMVLLMANKSQSKHPQPRQIIPAPPPNNCIERHIQPDDKSGVVRYVVQPCDAEFLQGQQSVVENLRLRVIKLEMLVEQLQKELDRIKKEQQQQ